MGGQNAEQAALASNRAVWIRTFQPGNYLLQCVETATIQTPSVKSLVGPCDDDGTRFSETGGDGTWATNIVGAGHLLVLNGWSSCVNDEDVAPNCLDTLGRYTKGWFAADSGTILRVTPTGLHRLATGLATLYAVSADAGRILVLHTKPLWNGWSDAADGTLAIYRSDGRLLRTLDVTTTVGAVRDARLQGNHIAVLTRTRVAILDSSTGKTLRTWPLPSPASKVRLQDLHRAPPSTSPAAGSTWSASPMANAP